MSAIEFYSNTSDVRELCKNVLVSDFPNTEIEEEQKTFKQFIDMKTKSTWDSNDKEYPIIQKIEQKYAAAEVIEHYGGDQGFTIAEKLRKQADLLLQGILDASDELDTDLDSLQIARTEFKTFPKNPDAKISRGRLTRDGYNAYDLEYAGISSSKYG